MKSTHKRIKNKYRAGPMFTALCKIENSTWAYEIVQNWAQVTCERCLKKRSKK